MNRARWFRDVEVCGRALSPRARSLALWLAVEAPMQAWFVKLEIPQDAIKAFGGKDELRRAIAELYAFGWIAPVVVSGAARCTIARLTRPLVAAERAA